MNIPFLILPMTTLLLASISSGVHAVNIVDDQNNKAVGHVRWHLQSTVDPVDLINRAIPNDRVSLFFIRPNDNDVEQTSANIAINDRFQVSLQPGSFTQVYSCTGINRISAVATGFKTNDLLARTSDFNLAPKSNYFFYVDVDTEGNSTIQEIESTNALSYIEDKQYQAHQITRVVPNCPYIEPTPPVVAVAPPLVLKEVVSIELEVLFDNDKAIIKSEYMDKVKELADFMNKYSNTHTVIEGHTDSNATDEYNQKLSERRANAVKYMLINRFGISPERLSAVGYGEQRPRATNATDAGRKLNRRVIATIEEQVVKPVTQ